MYKLLTPIVVSWNSKYEKNINTAYYEATLPSSILLDPRKEYGIALKNIETYYSFPNVKEDENNQFTYTKNAVETTLHLPTGCYDISTINSKIKELLDADADNITIESDVPLLKSKIIINTDFTVDFTKPNSINKLLGFDAKILNAGTNLSDEIVHINKVNSIFVNCDLATQSIVNGFNTQVIYSFFPNVPPGYKIIQREDNVAYLKVNRSQINSIRVWLTDQDGNILDFRGETITIELYLSEFISYSFY